ncbi:MAG: pentapeptide repeat-containing protein [Planctomycetes bacterium]|nr:pentapeptide repeat-containing protein [Planctomycetota bacterium]
MARTRYSPRTAPFPLRALPGNSEHPQSLEELVRLRLFHRRPRPLFLHGPSLRTLDLAMEHLAYVFADEERLVLAGDASLERWLAPEDLLCGIAADPRSVPAAWRAELLPVQECAIHDYLLGKHPTCAAKCIARLAHEPLPGEVLEDHERCVTVLEQLAHDQHLALLLSEAQLEAHVFLRRLRSSLALREKPSWTPAFCAELRKLLAQDPEWRQLLAEKLSDASGSRAMVLSACCLAEPGFRPPVGLQIPLEDLYLADIDLCGWELGGNVLRCDLSRAQLLELHARDLLCIGCRLERADLRGADFEGSAIDECVFEGADLRGARLVEIRSSQCSFRAAHLERADLRSATLLEAQLERARLDGANLAGALFCDAQLAQASLDGVRAEACSFTRCDLSGSSWNGANLRGASFAHVRCRNSDLGPADFRGARLDPETWQELRRLGAWV